MPSKVTIRIPHSNPVHAGLPWLTLAREKSVSQQNCIKIATHPSLPGARSPVIFFAVVKYVTPPKLVIPVAMRTSEFRPNYKVSLK